jgi:hypothetical protein
MQVTPPKKKKKLKIKKNRASYGWKATKCKVVDYLSLGKFWCTIITGQYAALRIGSGSHMYLKQAQLHPWIRIRFCWHLCLLGWSQNAIQKLPQDFFFVCVCP